MTPVARWSGLFAKELREVLTDPQARLALKAAIERAEEEDQERETRAV